MSGLVTWRALQPCMVDGKYREADEVFEAPDGEYAPDVREIVGAQNIGTDLGVDPTAKAKSTKAKAAPGVTPDELPENV